MATASVAVRKAAALENELGRGRDYKAVKGIPWFLEVFSNTPAAYSVAAASSPNFRAAWGMKSWK